MSLDSFKKHSQQTDYKSYIFLTYMYKEDLALKNLQGFIYHKTEPNQILYI